MAEDTMFSEAVAAARAGEVVRARDLLARLLRADSANPDYWLWMSAVVDSEREGVYCLRSITKMQPNHPLARLGLGVMGQISLGKEREVPVRQQRSAPMPHQSAGRINSMGEWWKVRRNRENIALSVLGIASVSIVVAIAFLQVDLAAIKLPFFGGVQSSVTAAPSETAGATSETTYQPVPTLKSTVDPSVRIPFATFVGADLTPTALYGLTPMALTGALDDAVKAFNEGRYDEALASLDQVLFLEPKSAQAHYLKGECFRKQWKMKEALEQYELAIALDPNYAPAYFGRAMWSKQNNPDNDYDKDLDRAIGRDPAYIDAYLERAYFFGRRGRWAEALTDLERANQIAPENALVLIRLGRAQIQSGMADSALDNIIRAQIIDPTILEGYLALGEAYDMLKLYSQAVQPLVIYTTYDPEEILGWIRLGEAYTGIGQYPQAVDSCTRAVDLNVNSVQARLCRGKVYRIIGEYKLAVADLQIASDKAPNWFYTQFPYGCALLEAGRIDLAIKTLTRAIELATTVEEKADAMGWLALSYEAYKNYDRAKALWKELMELEGVTEYWKTEAYVHYFGLNTPTPGGAVTPEETPEVTPEETPNGTPTPTP
ncbi:MAG: tetratricopeptide repeat protein [Anaerolineales bacterium]|nr:tetratricopeptide repeat protein [Anaerolineales bacterium]